MEKITKGMLRFTRPLTIFHERMIPLGLQSRNQRRSQSGGWKTLTDEFRKMGADQTEVGSNARYSYRCTQNHYDMIPQRAGFSMAAAIEGTRVWSARFPSVGKLAPV